jgi:hypothetical protein
MYQKYVTGAIVSEEEPIISYNDMKNNPYKTVKNELKREIQQNMSK